MGCGKYWGLGVRHIQLLLLLTCSVVNHIAVSGLTVAIMMVETEMVPSSNYTLFEDSFRTAVKSWSSTERQNLTNSIYYTIFAGYIIGGCLSTRVNPKITLMVAFFILSFFPYVIPTLTSHYGYQMMYAVRVCQGVIEGIIFPTVASILAKWIPYTEIARSMSMIIAAPYVGQCVVVLLGKFLQTSVGGWSSLFYISGNIGVLWVVAWFTFGFQDPIHCFYISTEEKFYIEKLTHDIQPMEDDVIIPWKDILRCKPYYGCLIESMFSVWAFEFVMNFRNFQSYVVNCHKLPEEEALYFINVIPVVFILIQLIVATVVDVMFSRQTFPLVNIRKTCNTIGYWGSAMFIFYVGYVASSTAALIFYHLMISMTAFGNVGALLTYFDLSPNWVGLLIGFSRALGYLPLIFGNSIINYMVPYGSYEKGWDNMYFIGGISVMFGNFIYTVLATDELQKFNKVTYAYDRMRKSMSLRTSTTS